MLKRTILLSVFAVLITASITAKAQAPVREIPAPINDIAVAGWDQFGPVIFYNPVLVAQAGPYVATFVRAHEYGHINLRTSDEVQADLYAVRALAFTNPEAIMAFVRLKASQGMGGGDATHAPGAVRAQYIYDYFRQITGQ